MGIIWDGSTYQKGDVDFSKLAGEIDLAILRVQYGYTIADDQYNYFVSECKKYGIPFNSYAFFAAVNTSDALAEEKTDNTRMDKSSVVAWIDVETMSVKSGKDADLQAAVNAYYDALKNEGWAKVGIYSGEYFYNSHGLANCKKDCLWLAAYGTNDGTMQTSHRPQVPGVDLWQYTSVGKLGAVNGNCDLSILVGTKPLSFFTGKEGGIQIGELVTVKPSATYYETGEAIAPFVKGGRYKVVQIKDVLKSYSHKAYLLDSIMSWVLEQDIVESGVSNGAAAQAPTEAQPPTTPAASEPAPAPVVAQAPEAAPTETKPQEPTPPAAPTPAPVEVVTPSINGQVYILIPDLEGAKLGYVHDYVMNRGWWIDITKNDDDTLNLEVGIFVKDSKPYNDFINYLKDGSFTYTERAEK